ncbi:MAG TPA: phosphoglycerate dehydrogenase [Kofleriaceae bacterium]|jgi:D-3-phosphoglycerate dehydrogenase|nr:phosphoglycerate dehydrogenase [Kofleriaceae bacterium]
MAETSFPKSEIKILLLENIHPVAKEEFAAEGFQVELVKGALPEDELVERVKDVHVLGIRSKTQVTPRVIDAGRRLLSVGAFCIGTNQINLTHANRKGVPVFNAPFSNTRSVAELILAEVVMLSRHLGDRVREVHAGQWKKVAVGSHEVRGKTIGIVGYGHIGSQVGVLAEAFGMRVVFYDIAAKLPMGNNRSLPKLEDVLEQSDFVTLHVPETPQTKWMIAHEQIARMKKGACLLNASRGTVVDIDALAAGLKSGHLGGAAVDVYPEEPETNSDGFKSALRGLTNVILTPHIGGSTEEAQEAIGKEVSAALIKFINQGATTGSVNFPLVELPLTRGAHRILNVHKNVPGVLRDINRIVSDLDANIRSQLLATDPDIGYLIMDLDKDVSQDVKKAVADLPTSIKTRILF